MRFLYVLSALAAVAFAAPAMNEASNSLEQRSCLPASCQSQGVSNQWSLWSYLTINKADKVCLMYSAALVIAATGV